MTKPALSGASGSLQPHRGSSVTTASSTATLFSPSLQPHRGSSVTDRRTAERFDIRLLQPHRGSSVTVAGVAVAVPAVASTPQRFVCNERPSELFTDGFDASTPQRFVCNRPRPKVDRLVGAASTPQRFVCNLMKALSSIPFRSLQPHRGSSVTPAPVALCPCRLRFNPTEVRL